MREFVIALVSGGVITYALGWLAGKKKNAAELEGKRLQNLESSIEIYERVRDELKWQLEDLSNKCSGLSQQITLLREENKSLKIEIHMLREENQSLKKEIQMLNKRLNEKQ